MHFACSSAWRFDVTLIFFAQSLFGIAFVIRTFQIFRARALLSTSFVTKTGTIFVSAALFGAFFCAEDILSALFVSCSCVIAAFALLFFSERRQIDALKSEIPYFLDRWILNLRLGLALNPARERALRDHSDAFQTLLRPLFAAQSLNARPETHALLTGALVFELERIQREPHAALARLENLRVSLRKADDFRRRSGHAVRQTRIQAQVMLVLLFALIVFSVRRYGWHRISDLVSAAIVLAALGSLCMYLLARKTKWKI
jgi:Flp pilus assembly protein TadB